MINAYKKLSIILAFIFIAILIAVFLFTAKNQKPSSTAPLASPSPSVISAANLIPLQPQYMSYIVEVEKLISADSNEVKFLIKPVTDPTLYPKPDPNSLSSKSLNLFLSSGETTIVIPRTAPFISTGSLEIKTLEAIAAGTWLRVEADTLIMPEVSEIPVHFVAVLDKTNNASSLSAVFANASETKVVTLNRQTADTPDITLTTQGGKIIFTNKDAIALDVYKDGKKIGEVGPSQNFVAMFANPAQDSSTQYQFVPKGTALNSAQAATVTIHFQ